MQDQEKKFIEAFVPRALLGSGNEILSAFVTREGLCPLRISYEGSQISSIEPIADDSSFPLQLLLPRFAEPHAHLDKAFTWLEAPNLRGGYKDALEANLQEQKNRTIQNVYLRAERALKLAFKNGIRAVRSHIDSFGISADPTWEALLSVQAEWHSLIELQLVALVPLEYWGTEQGHFLAARVAKAGGLLGGVLAPPIDTETTRSSLFEMLKIANELGCGIDIHIDESDTQHAEGLKLLIQVLDQLDISVPITCSHSSSMGLLPIGTLRCLADRLAHHRVNVVALPLTNFWLLGRQARTTPVQRPLAPILQLQKAGVTVAVGGDNVQDPWFPAGNFDPLALMSLTMPLTQLAPWHRLGLAPFTTAASTLMELEWDGTFFIGGPADFVLLEASSWSEALATPPSRQVIIHGKWVDDITIPTQNSTVL